MTEAATVTASEKDSMDIIAKIPHPLIPSFVTTIRYVGRAKMLQRDALIAQAKQPYAVLDPRTKAPIYRDGEIVVVWKTDIPEDYAIRALRDFVVGWEGLILRGQAVPYSDAALESLLDIDLDAPFEYEVEENGEKQKRRSPMSWAKHLERKSYDRATFDSDPLASSSVSS